MCLYLRVFLFKNFNINFMLYLFYTGSYYTVCLHFTLITTYAFHFNVIYMCLYLNMLTSISCYIYFVRDHITQYAYILLL